MKFRVTKKDLFIFAIFCFFLLYLCAIAILNFDSFATSGSFYGLLPFKAFNLHYLPLTLGMFFISLIVIFSSVSSYIFSKEKGKGFGFNFDEKTDKGYSRWAKEKEIKEDKGIEEIDPSAETLKAAGIPLINDGKKIWVDNGEYHNLILGTTGSGKTQTIVQPMVNILSKKGESMIVADPKGEIYQNSAEALKEKGYNIIVLNFRNPQNGNAWNPLTLPYKYYKEKNIDKATELLDDIALNILYDPNNKGEPFWEKSAADYFSGLAMGLFMDAKDEKEVNLNSINLMSTVGEERFGASQYIKEYFKMKGESSSAYVLASGTINAPSDTKGGILSTFRQKIRLFTSREKLSEMLAYSNFDMRSIGTEKTAVFMIIHDEKTTYHSLLTIFIKQCYETLVDVANENGGKLPFRTNFILDEFANMPPLKDVGSMVSAARSRDIRMTFIIQNFAQLNDVYGQEVAQVIKGNCNNLIYLLSTEIAALEEISKMCGEVKSKEKEKTASTPLITVTDLQKFKPFEALIMRSRKFPFRTKLTPNFEMNWGKKYELAEFPQRKELEVQLFDLKTYVSEEKRKQMMESGEKEPMNPFANPFGGGMMGPNPFMNNNFPSPNTNNTPNPFKPNPMSNIDIDKVMADIDKRLKELDEEEEKEKKALENKKEAEKTEKKQDLPKEKEDPKEEKKKELPKEEKKEEKKHPKVEMNKDKPKINVDVDSVIVNDNIITDDEFFDDFFQDE